MHSSAQAASLYDWWTPILNDWCQHFSSTYEAFCLQCVNAFEADLVCSLRTRLAYSAKAELHLEAAVVEYCVLIALAPTLGSDAYRLV